MPHFNIILALSSSTVSTSFWGWPVAASVGGILVFFGLLLEKLAGNPWYPNIDGFRQRESKTRWGWRLLMSGILVEIGVGFAIAVKDEMDAPLNQPIATISATVWLCVKGDGKMHGPITDKYWPAGITFFEGTRVDERSEERR